MSRLRVEWSAFRIPAHARGFHFPNHPEQLWCLVSRSVLRGGGEVYQSPPSISYVKNEWEIHLFSPFTRFFALLFLRGFMVCTGRIFLFIGSCVGPDHCGQHRQILLSKIFPFIYLFIFIYLLIYLSLVTDTISSALHMSLVARIRMY